MSEQSQSEPHVIRLPDGDTLEPRKDFARDLRVHPRTVQRMNLPTTYIGGEAYVKRNASLNVIAEAVRRPNQPVTRSARGGRHER
jgi:hypothetical protein